VGLEGGLRLQLVPPFPWPHLSSDGLEVDLTDGAHFNLELKFSINSNDFTRMVPNNLCSVMKEKCSPACTSLCLPCKAEKQMGQAGREAGGIQLRLHPMETWGKRPTLPRALYHGNELLFGGTCI
jgi:hypothetical protein